MPCKVQTTRYVKKYGRLAVDVVPVRCSVLIP